LCTAIAISCSWLAFELQTILKVYTTLTKLWKYFHYSPKRAECLKEIQRVLEMPEFKIVKPSDTWWLAHESFKRELLCHCHCSQQHIWMSQKQWELAKPWPKSTISAMFLLDYVLPQVTKLSKTLQTEKLDATVISSLTTLHFIYVALTPAANWVLALWDMEKELGGKNFSQDHSGRHQVFPRQCWNTFCFHFENKYL